MKTTSQEPKPATTAEPTVRQSEAVRGTGRRTAPDGNQDRLACPRKTTIGGQALIEGLLMIGPDKKAMAVRKLDGSIFIEQLPMGKFSKAAEIPFIRGSVRLFRQLVTGTSALMRSAELSEEEPAATATAATAETAEPSGEAVPAFSVTETGLPVLALGSAGSAAATAAAPSAAAIPSAADAAPATATGTTPAAASGATAPVAASGSADPAPAPRKSALDRFIESHMNLMLYGSVVLGLLFSVGLFILLPNFITSLVNQFTPLGRMTGWPAQVGRSLIEGILRITLFIGYLYFASRMKDIQRVWQYHGAEHKTIACYEAGRPLTVENARTYSRFHPRCGTAFMFIVIIVSIIVFSFLGWHSRWINLLIRFALVPVVAGISYEIIRLAGRHDNRFTRAISVPGLLLQRLTTAEPDDSMLEVAIAAMDAVRPPREGVQDKW